LGVSTSPPKVLLAPKPTSSGKIRMMFGEPFATGRTGAVPSRDSAYVLATTGSLLWAMTLAAVKNASPAPAKMLLHRTLGEQSITIEGFIPLRQVSKKFSQVILTPPSFLTPH
jgi:hypothetical protein